MCAQLGDRARVARVPAPAPAGGRRPRPGARRARAQAAAALDARRAPRSLALRRKVVLGHGDEQLGPDARAGRRGEAADDGADVPFYARWIAAPGAGVPVAVDPGDPARAVVDWAAAALECAARAGGLGDAPPPGSIAALDEARRAEPPAAVSTTPAEPAAPPGLDPIEGVSLATWAAVEVGVGRDRVPPAGYDAYARRHGVPAGRWAAVDAAWQARMTTDWRVGAAMGEALAAARKRR